LKSRPSTSPKAASEERDHALDLSEARDLLRAVTFVTLGVLASAVAIGACQGSFLSIWDSLTVAGCILLICWLATLLVVTMIWIPEVVLWSYRRIARWAFRKPMAGGGVRDEWLDGPT
jgi:hypothetical protein